MTKLTELKCVPVRSGDPSLTQTEIAELQPQIPNWKIIDVNGIPHLEAVFKFKNFVAALEFTNKVGALAEEEDHHPLIITEWGRVTIQLWTHVIKGLHRNDFIMAAKTDQLLN